MRGLLTIASRPLKDRAPDRISECFENFDRYSMHDEIHS
jgi:hypothetical protein